MKLNAKTEYACLAMLQLAEELAQQQPTPLRTLAKKQPIPDGFLTQILQDLRRSGLVVSTRGATGGYRLSRPPDQITLAEVIAAVEGDDPVVSNLDIPTVQAKVLVAALNEIHKVQKTHLQAITMADLALVAAGSSPMWYI